LTFQENVQHLEENVKGQEAHFNLARGRSQVPLSPVTFLTSGGPTQSWGYRAVIELPPGSAVDMEIGRILRLQGVYTERGCIVVPLASACFAPELSDGYDKAVIDGWLKEQRDRGGREI